MHRVQLSFALALFLGASGAFAQSSPPTDAPRTREEMIAAGTEGEQLGRQLMNSAPRVQYDEERQEITIPNQDTFHRKHLVGGAGAGSEAALSGLSGASAERLSEEGKAGMRRQAQENTDAGDAYRSLAAGDVAEVSRLQSDESLLGVSRSVFQSLSGASADARDGKGRSGEGLLSKALGDDLPDCGTTVDIRPGEPRVSYALTTETCELVLPRGPATRTRDVTLADVEMTAPGYANRFVTRDTTFEVQWSADTQLQILSSSAEFRWTGNVSNVLEVTGPSADTGWRGTYHVVYNAEACAGVPDTEPCADRVQTAIVNFFGTARVFEERFHCSTPDCLLDSDGWCTANWTCTDEGQREMNGIQIGEEQAHLLAPMFPGAPRLCFAARATYDCDIAEGELCWDSPAGRRCITQGEGQAATDTCPRILQLRIDNPGMECGLVSHRCAEEGSGHGDYCYVENQRHECRTPVRFNDIQVETSNSCAGALRCSGTECLPGLARERDNAERVDADSYGRQQARSLLFHHVLNDWTATAGPQRNERRWFHGRPLDCRKALGSAIDCCVREIPGAQAVWFDLYTETQRKAHAATSKALAPTDPGAAAVFASGAFGSDTLNRSLKSNRETIEGGGSGATGEGAGGMTLEQLMPTFLQRARETLRVDAGWTCRESEFDLAVLRSVGACSHVGTRCVGIGCLDKRDVYCCFNSPVSRYAQEAIAGTLAQPFGTARAPQCDGVTLETVSGTNWNNFVTDDLVARFQQAGILPSANTIRAATDMDALTGAGSTITADADPRLNVAQRTHAAMNQVDGTQVDAQIRDELALRLPAVTADPMSAGAFQFSPGYAVALPGHEVLLTVRRQGAVGAVSVAWRTRDGSADRSLHYVEDSGVLSWGNGDAEEKTLVIRTRTTTDVGSPTSPREFFVDLLSPSGGAVLGDVPEATVRLASGSEGGFALPPDPSTWLRFSATKRLIGATTSPVAASRPALEWEIRVQNRGGFELRNIVVFDLVAATGQPHTATWVDASACTASTHNTGQVEAANCQIARIAPFSSVTLRVITTAPSLPATPNPFTNTCRVFGAFHNASGQRLGTQWVEPQQCSANGTYPAEPVPPAGCEGVREYLGGAPLVTVDMWRDRLGTAFEGQWSANLFRAPRTVQALELDVPADAASRPALEFNFRRSRIGGATLRISQCAGDLRAPAGTAAPVQQAACKFVGNVRDSGSDPMVAIPISFTVGSDPGVCYLQAGSRYYINTLAVALPAALPTTPESFACGSGSDLCSLNWRWRTRPSQASQDDPNSCPFSYAVMGNEYVRPTGYSAAVMSWEQVFGAAFPQQVGPVPRPIGSFSLREQSPATFGPSVWKRYISVPFQVQAGSRFVLRRDIVPASIPEIGFLPNDATRNIQGQINISRCAGDFRPRVEAQSFGQFPEFGECRAMQTRVGSAGAPTITFGAGVADSECKLQPGVTYWLNVAPVSESDFFRDTAIGTGACRSPGLSGGRCEVGLSVQPQ